VQVSDNGTGFEGDVKELGKLFVRHTRGSGSSVGLYIVCQLVKRMDGRIAFQNGSNGGFVVEFDFPSAETSEVSGAEHSPYEATVAGRR
jgi:signal transduction histidine kinase